MANVYDKNKCIFCFNTLKKTDICFETVDDMVELVPDEVKYSYERRFDNMIDINDVRCLSRQPIKNYVEGDPEFDLDYETGIPIAWNQPGDGWTLKSTRRLCRFCHKPLPIMFGKRPNITVGLCGNSGSGKTVYMLSLIRDLRRVPGMAVTPDPVFFSQLDTDYERMYKSMYSGAIVYKLPSATNPTDILSPVVLNCSYSHRAKVIDFTVTIFDMAGEGMKNETYMAKQAIYLENAAGVIYLKNPDYFPGMSKEEEGLEEHAYLYNLFETITHRKRDAGKAHIAITMTKFDLLLNKYEGDPTFDDMKIAQMYANNPVTLHDGGFDVAKALRLNRRLYELFNWENTRDQEIRGLYNRQRMHRNADRKEVKKGFFARLFGRNDDVDDSEPVDNIKQWVMLFATSPLGRNAQFVSSNELALAPNGLMNVDPLLWILYCCDIYPPSRKSEDD